MSSLQKTIATAWQADSALCALVPFARFYTGRIPQTKTTQFPYVSLLVAAGISLYRTDKTRGTQSTVSFHVWVDDAHLEDGMTIAEAIGTMFADRILELSDTARIIDVLDGGEPTAQQVETPNVKAWEVIKLFFVHVERTRIDHQDDGCSE
jgi:hypothetical protein